MKEGEVGERRERERETWLEREGGSLVAGGAALARRDWREERREDGPNNAPQRTPTVS